MWLYLFIFIKSKITLFIAGAPRLPPKDRIVGRLFEIPNLFFASSFDMLAKLFFTGFPVTMQLAPLKYFFASSLPNKTALACLANIFVVRPGIAFCS